MFWWLAGQDFYLDWNSISVTFVAQFIYLLVVFFKSLARSFCFSQSLGWSHSWVWFSPTTCSFTKAQIFEIIGCPARKISTKTFRIPSWALPLAICHRTYLSSVPSRLIARPPLCLQTTANDGKESDSIRWHHVQSRMRMTAASMTGRRRVFARFAQSAGLSDGELTMFATSSLLGSLVRRCPLPAMVSDTPTSCPARSLSDSALHLWG